MSDDTTRYLINQRIDAPRRLIGLTYDEAIPALMMVGLGFMFDSQLIGMAVAAAYVMLMKWLKKGQGTYFLIALLFWHSSELLARSSLKKTPASCHRFFLK